MLMLKSTHDRIVSDDAKKLGEQAQLITKLTAELHDTKGKFVRSAILAADRLRKVESLETRLAVFTAPRKRNAKGHFLPVKSPIDEMIDALEAM